ncbi:MAG: PQQ-binding-like beta-propeller repeat protein, partial [Gemmatimonadota bacterium]|nr:PQQ-binding-like beta-propeller repeat protein [Gemmatimonadota bacterium]
MAHPTRFRPSITASVLLALAACGGRGTPDDPTARGEWPSYGATTASAKYSALDRIGPENVAALEIAWRWRSVDYDHVESGTEATIAPNYQTTPLKVGDRLYASTNLGQAAAIDPATGETIWIFAPHGHGLPRPAGRANRGVAYWSDAGAGIGGVDPEGAYDERVFLITGEYLVALDAATGQPVPEFGEGGAIHLAQDPDPRVLTYRWTSAPLVVRDLVVVSSSTMRPDRNSKVAAPGYVRAFDVRTGELRWRFNPIPGPGEEGHETWESDAWEYTGDAMSWTLLSADEERGLVYLPLKTTTNDWYGGDRPGDNLYGESLVCLDALTGEMVWYYQLVHHGLWDYDPPAAPILGDVTVDGRKIPAVFQVTKQAFVFAFDRVTGEPIWPIEERAVPPSDVPGEYASPTQPFPTWPLPFDLQGITEDDLIDFTPELRAEALDILDGFVYGPMFTPPSVKVEGGTQGTILMPGWVGGANWNGAAFDPETGMLYVPSVTSPNVTALVEPDDPAVDHKYIRGL